MTYSQHLHLLLSQLNAPLSFVCVQDKNSSECSSQHSHSQDKPLSANLTFKHVG